MARSLATLSENAPKSAVAPAPRVNEDPQTTQIADEIGGPEGPDPTRYGDWERKGRCIDF